MATKTQEALSAPIAREDILGRIPQFEIQPVFLRQHLDRELVIGTIGDRGGGKSASDAVIGLVDFMLSGKPVWSNMEIKCDIEINDDTAKRYGLNYGGTVHFESQPLEKDVLLALDERYKGGCLVIEEINVQYSNVRRFMSNTNVDFNLVCQQLRKFKTSLVYNVIDEMFIDSQLRYLTDVFIKTYDTAFDLDALFRQKQTGIDFKWKIYPMSGYLAGEQGRYPQTHKTLPSVYFHFLSWRGIYNSMGYQEKGVYSMSAKEKQAALKAGMSVESSSEMVKEINEWGWLEEKAKFLRDSDIKYLEPYQLWRMLGIAERGIRPNRLGEVLPNYGIRRSGNGYKIEDFKVEDLLAHTQQPVKV